DLKKHTNMRFTWEAESRKKGRKITHLIFDFSFKPDQMDLAIEEPKKKSNFDIFDLRNRLKKWAKLESKKINKRSEERSVGKDWSSDVCSSDLTSKSILICGSHGKPNHGKKAVK